MLRFVGILLLLVLIALGVARPAWAQTPPPVSLEYYREAVERAWQRLQAGDPLDAARAELADIAQVRLPSGEVVEVYPVLEDVVLRETALERLALLRAELDAALAADPAPALATLEELRRTLGLGRLSWWERLLRWFQDLMSSLLPREGIVDLSGPGLWLAWILALLGVGLIALILGIWLRDLMARWVREAETSESQETARPLPASAEQAQIQARSQAQAGNYREAVRLLYLAALLHLAESGLLRFEPSLTNQEVLARVPENAPWRAYLEPVIRVFDRVWYGVREPDAETFQRYQEAIQQLMQATQEAAHASAR